MDPRDPDPQAHDPRPHVGTAGDEDDRQLARLDALLASDRVMARPGFARQVMAALPARAPWADRRVQGWRSSLLALAALVALALGFLGIGGARLAPASPALAAARAVADFGMAAALSGAGLLAASWRGVGMALGAALDLPAQVVFGLGVLAVNALLLVLLRRGGRSWRRRAVAAATTRRWR
ncbi:MAG TPA: hypothetical protein VGV61_11110 [Thermoanaerobaculia bacterium]|nr:hypothetical protein [Thermoanaerobaculia bacterium]